jgi:UDP-glucose 4-epimerase
MTKYLVTGSTGFIGSRLLGLLNTIECDVRLLARSEVNNYETVACNLGQDRIPKRTLESIDTVFHLAGFAHDMQDASKVEELYRAINVDATVELAKLAVESGVKRFVFISSVKAGGDLASGKCINESDQNEPEGVYGKSKREAELKLLKIGNESGMHVSIIRPSLVYGPNVKGNLQLMLSGVKKGWFPPLPETNNKRSMIHVDDLVLAILLVADDDRASGEIFIATDGTPHSSREIYNAMCSALDKSIPKWSVPKFLFDMAPLASPRIKYKLNKLLGDECYSSAKLEALGFKAQKTLKDMNETSF